VIPLLKAFFAPLAYCLIASTTLEASRRLTRRALCAGAVLCALLVSLPAPNAVAGVFQVANCDADKLNYSTRAFTHFATRRMMIKRACNPVGPGLRGLITANVVHDGRIKRGSFARVVFNAPPGTRITRFDWGGSARRRDCRYALQMWASAPEYESFSLMNVKANSRCASAGRAQSAYFVKNFDVPRATTIVQRVLCKGKGGRPWCSARGRNYIRTRSATVQLVDDLAPTVEILQDTPLASGAWVSGTQPLNYTASDNVGVQLARTFIGGRERGLHNRECLLAAPTGPFAHPLPCPNGPGQIIVRTHELAVEGSQQLIVSAQDAAGNNASSGPVTARIDNTPPARVDAAVEGGGAWRNRNDWAIVWTNASEGDRAPITEVRYELCKAGGSDCSRGSLAGLNVSRLPMAVPHPGEWTLSVWRRDAAGNEAEDNASVPVTLRYDPEPPQLAFEAQLAADPTLVTVGVTDPVSGLADGAIEISAAGSGVWQTLATQKDGSRLVTRIDDAALPPGGYVLRARARDQAGNEASTDRRVDGQPMAITLPLRTGVAFRAGFERTIARRGKRRPVVVLRPAARVGFMERARIVGRLATSDGRAISGAPVQVLSRTGTEPDQLVDTLTTDADGRFRSVATGTNSRTLRLVYGGSSLTLPTQTALEMRVPAATSVRVSRRRLRNGQAVTFSGRVRGLPVPAAGKLVEVQVRFSDRWQTFRTTRSDATGSWSSRYRFQRTRGVQHYHFRVRLPNEGGYPFETSVSRTLAVQVRGR
jgi:hypothetical protein